MLQLIYISTARAPVDQALLGAILETSRANNQKAGVTGLLVSGGRRFLQALEGPERSVLDTYARIQADPRHFALVLLSCRTVEARSFGAWSMAYEGAAEIPDGAGLAETVGLLVERVADPNMRAQFTGFAELHASAA
jgi:hypothetical protein